MKDTGTHTERYLETSMGSRMLAMAYFYLLCEIIVER